MARSISFRYALAENSYLKNDIKKLQSALKQMAELARRGHRYSCRLGLNGFFKNDVCTCGADEHNAKVDEILKTIGG